MSNRTKRQHAKSSSRDRSKSTVLPRKEERAAVGALMGALLNAITFGALESDEESRIEAMSPAH